MRGETLIGASPPGVLGFTIGTDCTAGINNDVDTYKGGTPTPSAAGSILLDEATESQERAGWRTLDLRLSSDPQMIITP
jgi:hypothetical protein